jgi:hypothetical protein
MKKSSSLRLMSVLLCRTSHVLLVSQPEPDVPVRSDGHDYLCAPKQNRSGDRGPYYDFMREAAQGDVFSFTAPDQSHRHRRPACLPMVAA